MKWMGIGALVVVCLLAAPSVAQPERENTSVVPATTVRINATGEVTAEPDMAVVTFGVVSEGSTTERARSENARRMQALVAALRAQGVAERDIQTSWVWAWPRYYDSERLYRFNNSVTVKVRRVENTGRILDAAVAAGGNTVSGVSFGYQDPAAQLDRARQNAIEDAQHRAQLYAHALGLRVVRVISLTESGAVATNDEEAIVVTGTRMQRQSFETPIAAGEVTTRVQMSLTYALAP